jgi:hypothetical protein
LPFSFFAGPASRAATPVNATDHAAHGDAAAADAAVDAVAADAAERAAASAHVKRTKREWPVGLFSEFSFFKI